jgi:prephenate dehydratase
MENGDETLAAIASAAAADFYGAEILVKSIEDDRQNYTRFFLLRRQAGKIRAKDVKLKTSIVFTTPNKPGALFRCMSAFALRDVSLTKIESRPLKGRPWEYLFYLDFLGSPEEANCRNAMSHLREMVEMMAVLGCYPQAA